MHRGSLTFVLASALLWAASSGCNQSSPPKSASAAPHADGDSRSDARPNSATAERECTSLVDTINGVLVEIERVSARRSAREQETRRDLGELATLYETLRARLARLQLDTAELRGFSNEYLDMIQKVQKSMKEVVSGLDRHDVARVERAQADFGKVIAIEDELVDRINAFCEGPKTARHSAATRRRTGSRMATDAVSDA